MYDGKSNKDEEEESEDDESDSSSDNSKDEDEDSEGENKGVMARSSKLLNATPTKKVVEVAKPVAKKTLMVGKKKSKHIITDKNGVKVVVTKYTKSGEIDRRFLGKRGRQVLKEHEAREKKEARLKKKEMAMAAKKQKEEAKAA